MLAKLYFCPHGIVFISQLPAVCRIMCSRTVVLTSGDVGRRNKAQNSQLVLVDSTSVRPTESFFLQRGHLDRSLCGLGSVPLLSQSRHGLGPAKILLVAVLLILTRAGSGSAGDRDQDFVDRGLPTLIDRFTWRLRNFVAHCLAVDRVRESELKMLSSLLHDCLLLHQSAMSCLDQMLQSSIRLGRESIRGAPTEWKPRLSQKSPPQLPTLTALLSVLARTRPSPCSARRFRTSRPRCDFARSASHDGSRGVCQPTQRGGDSQHDLSCVVTDFLFVPQHHLTPSRARVSPANVLGTFLFNLALRHEMELTLTVRREVRIPSTVTPSQAPCVLSGSSVEEPAPFTSGHRSQRH